MPTRFYATVIAFIMSLSLIINLAAPKMAAHFKISLASMMEILFVIGVALALLGYNAMLRSFRVSQARCRCAGKVIAAGLALHFVIALERSGAVQAWASSISFPQVLFDIALCAAVTFGLWLLARWVEAKAPAPMQVQAQRVA